MAGFYAMNVASLNAPASGPRQALMAGVLWFLRINWEEDDLHCDHCGNRIESAYAEGEL
jgi:hypothetical protein